MRKKRSIDTMDPAKSKAQNKKNQDLKRKIRSIDAMDPDKSQAQNKKN